MLSGYRVRKTAYARCKTHTAHHHPSLIPPDLFLYENYALHTYFSIANFNVNGSFWVPYCCKALVKVHELHAAPPKFIQHMLEIKNDLLMHRTSISCACAHPAPDGLCGADDC
jgi:hypothetical protein